MPRSLKIALLFVLMGVGIALIARVTEDGAPPLAGDLCGLGDEAECQVPAPPCEAAGEEDQNPSDRRVEPADGLQFRDSPTAPLPFGFNDPAVMLGQLTPEQDATLNEMAGSSVVRVVLDWGAVEATPNEFDFSRTDALYCEALAADVAPLFTVTGIPSWSLGEGSKPCAAAPCVQPPGDAFLSGLRRFAELAAIRYPRSAAFEVWNEPNFIRFWPQPDPTRYAAMARELYAGVKNGVPSLPVIAGSVSNNPNDQPDTGNLSLSTFLTEMFAAGAADHMDGLSVHGYPIGSLGSTSDLFTSQVAEARRLAAAAAPDRTLPMWVTETGATTVAGSFAPAVSEDEQAEQLVAIHSSLQRDPETEMVLFHALLEPIGIPGDAGFGWFTAVSGGVFEPKPVVCAFREIAGRDGCPKLFNVG